MCQHAPPPVWFFPPHFGPLSAKTHLRSSHFPEPYDNTAAALSFSIKSHQSNRPSMLHSTTPQRRIVSDSLSPQEDSHQSGIESHNAVNGSLRRKGSFSFLRRSKSRERSVSGSSTPTRKLSKKDRSRVRQQEMMQEQIPSPPPRIPIIPHPPDLQGFGGEDTRPDSVAIMSNRAGGSFKYRLAHKSSQETLGSDMYRGMPVPPVPPIPSILGIATTPKSYVDAFPRTESMVNRGRHSYASSAISTINSPRKIRRRKDPTPFK